MHRELGGEGMLAECLEQYPRRHQLLAALTLAGAEARALGSTQKHVVLMTLLHG